jgi:predicted transport protein
MQKKGLKIFINTKIGTLDDPKGLAKDVSNIGHRGNGDYQIQIENDKDLEYIMSLIKQVIK